MWKDELKRALGLSEERPMEEEVEVVVRGQVVTVPRMTVAELFEQLGLEGDKYIALDLDSATPLCQTDSLPDRVGIVPVRVDG